MSSLINCDVSEGCTDLAGSFFRLRLLCVGSSAKKWSRTFMGVLRRLASPNVLIRVQGYQFREQRGG